MVSKFGTGLSSGAGRIDLSSYTKKTDLGTIALTVSDLQTKFPDLEQQVATGSISVPVRWMLYKDILSILKTTTHYALATPDTHYTNLAYTVDKIVSGNYAGEHYTRNPYQRIELSSLGNTFYIYTACRFAPLSGQQSGGSVVLFSNDNEKSEIKRNKHSETAPPQLLTFVGGAPGHQLLSRIPSSGVDVLLEVKISLVESVGDDSSTRTAEFSGKAFLKDSSVPLGIQRFSIRNTTTFHQGVYTTSEDIAQHFFAINSTALNDQDKEQLISFFVKNRI